MAATGEILLTPGFEVLDCIAQFHRGSATVGDLRLCLDQHTTWLMTAPVDPVTDLAGLVELTLAEMDAGHATKDDLREEIGQYVGRHETIIVIGHSGPVASIEATTNAFTEVEVGADRLVLGGVGTRPEEAAASQSVRRRGR